MPPEPVAALRLRFAGMPRLAVHGADHPVRGNLPRDPPPPIRPVASLGRFHVLPGDQRQKPQRVRRRLVPLRRARANEGIQHRQSVIHQVADQALLRGRVVPVDVRLARPGVTQLARRRDHLAGAGHHPRHLADRGHQLGDGVLGGDRVVEHRRVHAPLPPAAQDPGLRDDLGHRVEHPVRAVRLRDPLAPVHQRRRVKRHLQQRPAARHLPPQVELQRVRGLGIRQVIQLLEHQHRPDQVRRQRRPPGRRGEQVRGELVGEQLPPVLSQEREHAARRHQVPGDLARVPQVPLHPRSPLHKKIIPEDRTHCRQNAPAALTSYSVPS